MRISLALCVPLFCFSGDGPRDPGPELELVYLGNAGFLARAGDRSILIDALVSTSMKDCVDQEQPLREALMAAEPPYDVDLVLTTHVHGDHFDAEAVGRHLVANPRAVFVSTEQAVARLESEFADYEQVAARVRAVSPKEGHPVELPELGLTVFDLHHGRDLSPMILNHGFLIELGGRTLLHMGDTVATAEELAATGLEGRIDLALVPFWYFDAEPWKGAIESALWPARAAVMHLAPRWYDEPVTDYQRESAACVARIRAAHPEVVILERPGERLVLEPAAAIEPSGVR